MEEGAIEIDSIETIGLPDEGALSGLKRRRGCRSQRGAPPCFFDVLIRKGFPRRVSSADSGRGSSWEREIIPLLSFPWSLRFWSLPEPSDFVKLLHYGELVAEEHVVGMGAAHGVVDFAADGGHGLEH